VPVTVWLAVTITLYSGVEYLLAAGRWFAQGH
jgi:hypothetical protein